MIGKTLAHYKIVEKIGAGGMGEVYRARDGKLDREVAVKVLPADVAAQPQKLAQLEHEAKSVAALNHPNIVTLFSIEEANGVRFLTMELVKGETLDRRVRVGGLPLEEVLDLAIPLADALATAHDHGVVHRDLKPGNVMVTHEGRVKVLDFGLAKLASPGPASEATVSVTATPVSAPGRIAGTVPYMAPEQIRGEAVDARTDLFALGILLYELVTGTRPFGGDSSADVASAILRDVPEPAQDVREHLPPDVARVIHRCLEKDPDRRVQTARDVRNELELVKRTIDPTAATHGTPPSYLRSSPAATKEEPHREAPSIAVLPFVSRSRDEEDVFFADGLADELTSVLGKVRGLRVAARTSAFQFKDKSEDLTVIGDKLRVETILEGSIRKAGDRLRVAVQLVKAVDGFHLWTETYDRTLEDILAVQDDIAQSVVKELRTKLLGEDPDSAVSGRAKADVAAATIGRGESGEAHRLFIQGRHLVNRFELVAVQRGVRYLEQALELEPDHAQAWAALAFGQAMQSAMSECPIEGGMEDARASARRAMDLMPDLVEGHIALGFIQSTYDWDWSGAEASFTRALELQPDDSRALRLAAGHRYALGRSDQALDLALRALETDPLSESTYTAVARVYRGLGRLAEAEEAYRKAVEISPTTAATHLNLATVLLEQGRIQDALAVAEEEPSRLHRLCARSIVLAADGRMEQSKRSLDELKNEGVIASFEIAEAHAARGEIDEAFEWLEQGYQIHDSGLRWVKVAAALRPLHSDPRWQTFLEKMGLAG